MWRRRLEVSHHAGDEGKATMAPLHESALHPVHCPGASLAKWICQVQTRQPLYKLWVFWYSEPLS